MNNNLVKPKELMQTREAQREQVVDQQFQMHDSLRCLVQLKGWQYVKGMAMELLAEYECKPPKEDKDKTKWETYTQLNWAINQLIHRVEKQASQQPKVEKTNANRRK